MASKALTISIIIPAYNEERHIRACLEAIANQTIKPDEVIVVDNNSTDKTAEITQSYPFVTILHEKRQGVVFARNRGFNAARSRLIGRIDADTIVPPDWVARIREFYTKSSHVSSVLSGGCYFYNIRLPRFTGWWQGQIAFRVNRLLLGHYIVFGSNMVVPSKVWHDVRAKVCHDIAIHEDLDLAIHMHRLGYRITYQETLKVGIKMRRVRSERHELWENMMLWPHTLRTHGLPTWIFGWVGAALLYAGFPILLMMESIARLCGKPALPE